MSLAFAALAVAVTFGPLDADPAELEGSRQDRVSVTAGAQCRYANGSKAIVLRTKNPRRQLFIFREKELVRSPSGALVKGGSHPGEYPDSIDVLVFDRSGRFRHDAQGGLTSYHMIELAVDHLLKQPYTPLTSKSLDTFLRATNVPKCARATYDADLYDKR